VLTVPTNSGSLRRHWNNRKYGVSNLKFPHAKEFLRKLGTISARAVRKFTSPVLGRKKLERYRGEVMPSQVIGLPVAPAPPRLNLRALEY